MADIHLHAGSASSVTCVSNYFIDHFLKGLSGDAVKVYLAILRCLGDRDMSFSCSAMAECVGMTARDVRTSLDALSSSGLVALDYDSEGELCDICVKDCSAQDDRTEELSEDVSSDEVSESPEIQDQEDDLDAVVEEDDTPVPEMRDHLNTVDRSDPGVKTVLFIAQRYLGRTLSNDDLRWIMYWYYDLHMSVDVIDYLITSCLEKGKTSVRYMNQVAISWYKKGIRTKDAASNEQMQFSSETNTVRKAFGIAGHAMTPAEMEYIDRWFHEWGFAPELVEEACSRTILNTGKPNYSYANTILKDWHDKGITTAEQVSADDEEHRQENEKKYPHNNSTSAPNNKSSFSFSETNGYDDAAIAAAMLKRSTF